MVAGPQLNLNDIGTVWTDIFAAHALNLDESARAQAAVLERYMPAVQACLQAAVRDPHLAEDLAQDFACRFLKGDFSDARPSRGKFRNFVKTVLRNQVIDHFRKKHPLRLVDAEHLLPDLTPRPEEDLDQMFREKWREEILHQVWLRLEKDSSGPSQRFLTVLQSRVEFPQHGSQELAAVLSARLGKTVTPDWVRQNLRRARERFASLLRTEIGLTLDNDSATEIDEELAALDLKKFCC